MAPESAPPPPLAVGDVASADTARFDRLHDGLSGCIVIADVPYLPFVLPARRRPVMATDEFPQLLRTSEVARMLGVTTRTINRYVQENRLQATRTPGGHSRFLLTDVQAFIVDPKPAASRAV